MSCVLAGSDIKYGHSAWTIQSDDDGQNVQQGRTGGDGTNSCGGWFKNSSGNITKFLSGHVHI